MLEALQTLISIIFREADPNLTLMPLPLAVLLPLITGAVGAVGSRIQSGQAARGLQDQGDRMIGRGEETEEEGRGISEEAEEARSEYGLARSFADLRNRVLEDPVSDFLRGEARRQEATNLAALEAGGPRAVIAGVPATAQRTLDMLAKIADEENQRVTEGLKTVGTAETRVEEQRLVDARSDLDYGRGLTAEGLSQQYGGEDMQSYGDVIRRQGNTQLFTDLATAGLDFLGETDWAQNAVLGNSEDGGKVPMYEDSGELMRGETPGEFSHKNNPIDVMKDGAKIGELTGGEGVMSPRDMGEMEQLAGKGDSPLHRFVRGWFKKINSKKNG